MNKQVPKNIGASVRDRLRALARERNEDVSLTLSRYVNERLLYRLSASPRVDQVVLKGAALFSAWLDTPYRATRDLDFLGSGSADAHSVRSFWEEVLATDVPGDGVSFDASSLDVSPIREDQEYGGMRVELIARVTTARVRVQVDVGFGDAVTPGPVPLEFPALLDFPSPRVRAYPRETVVAEKLEAMVTLGLANSRMKDFYDVAVMARAFDFDGAKLCTAITRTFERRRTPLPHRQPVALADDFAADRGKQEQWSGFVRKSGAHEAGELSQTVAAVRAFLTGPLEAAAAQRTFAKRWTAAVGWSTDECNRADQLGARRQPALHAPQLACHAARSHRAAMRTTALSLLLLPLTACAVTELEDVCNLSAEEAVRYQPKSTLVKEALQRAGQVRDDQSGAVLRKEASARGIASCSLARDLDRRAGLDPVTGCSPRSEMCHPVVVDATFVVAFDRLPDCEKKVLHLLAGEKLVVPVGSRCLRRVSVTGHSKRTVVDLSALRDLPPTLTSLHLWDMGVTDVSPIAGFTHLETLSLTQVRLPPEMSLDFVREMTSLRTLEIHSTPVTPPNAEPLKHLPRLSKLDLRGVHLPKQ